MAPPSGNVSRPGRALAVLGVLIVVLFLAIVGGNVGQPSKWGSDFKVKLGLDLTSGTTVALEAQPPKGVSSAQFATDMTQAKNIMESRVNGAGFTEAQVQQQGSNIINVSVPGANSQKVIDLVGTTAQLLFRQVLLLAPNTTTGTATPTPTPTPSSSATATPSASTKAKVSISPNASTPDPAGHARLLAARAKASPTPSATGSATPTPAASATPTSGLSTTADAEGDASLVSAHTKALFDKLNCANKNWKSAVGYTGTQYNNPDAQTVSCGSVNGVLYKYALNTSPVLGKDIKSATAGLSSTSVNWQVNVTFKAHGASAWGTLTTNMFNKYGTSSANDEIAMVLDGVVISSPVVEGAMNTGTAQITGSFTENQATTLANQLSYGALPLTFSKQSIQTISPTLGSDQLHAGLLAGAIGLLLVVLYCLFYYRGLAVVAVSSLAVAAVLVYEAIVLLGKHENLALELSGVAGLIVAIGITADSFVVFFERLRDEVRDGRTLRTAVERGWKRARRTVLVSDTVSFLAAALLWYFSIGEVKGFAFTLGLTTVIDVVVVFLFTKPMITLLARTKFYGQGHRWSGLDPARLGARAPWRSTRPARATTTTATPPKEA